MKPYSQLCLLLLAFLTMHSCDNPTEKSLIAATDAIRIPTVEDTVPHSPLPDSSATVEIIAPLQGQSVCWQSPVTVRATATSLKAVIFVVHPVASGYWVQDPLSPYGGGIHKATGHFGINPFKNDGEKFEIRAFINPHKVYKKGDEIPGWPEAEFSSTTVMVTRKGC